MSENEYRDVIWKSILKDFLSVCLYVTASVSSIVLFHSPYLQVIFRQEALFINIYYKGILQTTSDTVAFKFKNSLLYSVTSLQPVAVDK